MTEELTQTEGKAALGRSALRKPLSKNAPWTAGLITVELAHVHMQEHVHMLNGQIPDGALVAAVNPMSGRATCRTGGTLCHPFTGENQMRGLSTVGKKAEVAQMRKEDIERQGNTP